MGGEVNSLNSPKLKPILAFVAIFSFLSISLQAQTSTKTLKLFAPPSGLATDSILLWRSDSTVRKMNAQALIGSDAWLVTGNGSTTPTTNFIGTTNATDFVAKTNNTERARITSGGDVQINGSGVANNSGLVFNNLKSSTPVSAGATLGVDATGRVVTVQGSSFSPAFGQAVLSSTKTVAVNQTVDLLQVTLPVPGTYLITYCARGESSSQVTVGNVAAAVFLKAGTGTEIPNTRILTFQFFPAGALSAGIQTGATGTGTLVRQVTNSSGETLTLSMINLTSGGTTTVAAYSDAAGITQISYVKITP